MNLNIQNTYLVVYEDSKDASYNYQIFNHWVIGNERPDIPALTCLLKKLIDQSLLSFSGITTENGNSFKISTK